MCYNIPRMVTTKKNTKTADKAAQDAKDLEAFVENVNKKDRPNGRKVHFAFVKRKRQNT